MTVQSEVELEAYPIVRYVHPLRHRGSRRIRSRPLGAGRGAVIEVRIGDATIRVWMETKYLETVFEDRTKIGATPDPERDYDTARAYGYGSDTTALWLDHDPAHSWLAQKNGMPVSPALWAAAHDQAKERYRRSTLATWDEQAKEESYVLDFQRFVQTGENRRDFSREWREEFLLLRAILAAQNPKK